MLVERRSSRARLYRDFTWWLKVVFAGRWSTLWRAAAGSGAAFESPAPELPCMLAPCSALGLGAAPADPSAPGVRGRLAQLFGKGAA